MIIFSDDRCLEYGRAGHPERPQRISATVAYLQQRYPGWTWQIPLPATREDVLRVHTAGHWESFSQQQDFDADTAWFPDILDHALRAAGGALAALQAARVGQKSFSLLRPPGHHALSARAMGFCYLNSVVIAAQAALNSGVERVAIWDFDAHHGNGTEALVAGDSRIAFASVHQLPGWPGSGAQSFDNIRNYPVPPHSPRPFHLKALRQSLDDLLATDPQLLLVSAGFDAFADDPITEMTLREEDFQELGRWLHAAALPTAAILEGGYSEKLPELVSGFLDTWENG